MIFAIFRFIVSKFQVYVSPWKPLKVLATSWVLCLLARPRTLHSTIFQKKTFSRTTALLVQTRSMLISYHITMARSCQTLEQKGNLGRNRKNAFVGFPPFLGPKNIRFRHGFKRILNKNLIFAIFRFILWKLGVYISNKFHAPGFLETIGSFWPLRGFYVC